MQLIIAGNPLNLSELVPGAHPLKLAWVPLITRGIGSGADTLEQVEKHNVVIAVGQCHCTLFATGLLQSSLLPKNGDQIKNNFYRLHGQHVVEPTRLSAGGSILLMRGSHYK